MDPWVVGGARGPRGRAVRHLAFEEPGRPGPRVLREQPAGTRPVRGCLREAQGRRSGPPRSSPRCPPAPSSTPELPPDRRLSWVPAALLLFNQRRQDTTGVARRSHRPGRGTTGPTPRPGGRSWSRCSARRPRRTCRPISRK